MFLAVFGIFALCQCYCSPNFFWYSWFHLPPRPLLDIGNHPPFSSWYRQSLCLTNKEKRVEKNRKIEVGKKVGWGGGVLFHRRSPPPYRVRCSYAKSSIGCWAAGLYFGLSQGLARLKDCTLQRKSYLHISIKGIARRAASVPSIFMGLWAIYIFQDQSTYFPAAE